jgi:UDP-2-acetamido-3-amino-2,3-dideoxy-glucuronate N-acetyltransferase
LLIKKIKMTTAYFVHLSSIVDSGARIGDGARIWHFCHVMAGASIGAEASLGQNVFVASGAFIGNRVKIQNNVSIYKGVEVGDDVFIGPSVVFTNVINPRSFIDRKAEIKPTVVHHGASIGANATIICGIRIGSFAMIGAGSVVTGDVAANALVVGNPAKQIGWVGRSGNTLVFDEAGRAIDPSDGLRYQLKDNQLMPDDLNS